MRDLNKLQELIDEAITMDKVEDIELGEMIREWFWSKDDDDDVEWDDLTEDSEWSIDGWDDDE